MYHSEDLFCAEDWGVNKFGWLVKTTGLASSGRGKCILKCRPEFISGPYQFGVKLQANEMLKQVQHDILTSSPHPPTEYIYPTPNPCLGLFGLSPKFLYSTFQSVVLMPVRNICPRLARPYGLGFAVALPKIRSLKGRGANANQPPTFTPKKKAACRTA